MYILYLSIYLYISILYFIGKGTMYMLSLKLPTFEFDAFEIKYYSRTVLLLNNKFYCRYIEQRVSKKFPGERGKAAL